MNVSITLCSRCGRQQWAPIIDVVPVCGTCQKNGERPSREHKGAGMSEQLRKGFVIGEGDVPLAPPPSSTTQEPETKPRRPVDERRDTRKLLAWWVRCLHYARRYHGDHRRRWLRAIPISARLWWDRKVYVK